MGMKVGRKLFSEILKNFGGNKQERKKFDQERLKANKELAELLAKLVEENPNQRFSQILKNFGFVKHTRPAKQETCDNHNINWKDEFYEEPQKILERVKARIKNNEAKDST
jgi:hypothetical protein